MHDAQDVPLVWQGFLNLVYAPVSGALAMDTDVEMNSVRV
jgi:hypothetical protein